MGEENSAKSPGRRKGVRYFRTVRSIRAFVGRIMLAMEEQHCPRGEVTKSIDTDAARCMGYLAKTLSDIISKTALEERIEALERQAIHHPHPPEARAH